MNIQDYLEEMKLIEQRLLEFIENENNTEDDIQKLAAFLRQIFNGEHDIERILLLLSKISNNHHRFPNFFRNIEQINTLLSQ